MTTFKQLKELHHKQPMWKKTIENHKQLLSWIRSESATWDFTEPKADDSLERVQYVWNKWTAQLEPIANILGNMDSSLYVPTTSIDNSFYFGSGFGNLKRNGPGKTVSNSEHIWITGEWADVDYYFIPVASSEDRIAYPYPNLTLWRDNNEIADSDYPNRRTMMLTFVSPLIKRERQKTFPDDSDIDTRSQELLKHIVFSANQERVSEYKELADGTFEPTKRIAMNITKIVPKNNVWFPLCRELIQKRMNQYKNWHKKQDEQRRIDILSQMGVSNKAN